MFDESNKQFDPEVPSGPNLPDNTGESSRKKLTQEDLQERRNALIKAGFSEEFIQRAEYLNPSLWSTERPQQRLEELSQRGFSNPIKMIETMSQVLGLSFENIDRRLELFSRLVSLYGLPIVPTEAMEKNLTLWSAKFDKLIVLARILRDYEVPKQEVEQRMSQIIVVNLENLLIALKNKKEGESISALTKRAREAKKQGLSREEKRDLIGEDLESLKLERMKITKRYFRGYPDKEK